MTEQRAKRILGDAIVHDRLAWSAPDGRLVDWYKEESTAYVSGRFTVLELEAIAWWVEHKQRRG